MPERIDKIAPAVGMSGSMGIVPGGYFAGLLAGDASPVFKVERGCPSAPGGCGCTGQCHELIEVVPASEYYRLLGRIEQLERINGGAA